MKEMKWTKALAALLSTLIVAGGMMIFAAIGGQAGAQDDATKTDAAESAAAEPAPAEQAVPANVNATSGAMEGKFLTEEEKQAAIQFLKNKEKIERILGPGQKFYYDPNKLRQPFKDPMIIPWSYISRVLPDLVNEAKTMIQQGKLEEAERRLTDININFPDNPLKEEVATLLSTIEEIRKNSSPGVITPTPTPVFPVKILNDTRAILYSEDEPLVLIGDDVLKVGDKVPYQGDAITVRKIDPNRVEFEYKGVVYEKVIDALGQTE